MTKKAEALLKMRNMSLEDLHNLCDKEQRAVFVSKLKSSSIEEADADKLLKREVRKNIARIKTIIREKSSIIG